ncbi:hypothetical protein ACWGTI_29430 [Mesorhizobium sp. ArgA1]
MTASNKAARLGESWRAAFSALKFSALKIQLYPCMNGIRGLEHAEGEYLVLAPFWLAWDVNEACLTS